MPAMPAQWTVGSLLRWWHGRPQPADTEPAAPAGVPAELVDLHRLLAAYEPIVVTNRLVPLEELELVDGLHVFWVEAEETSEWGTDGAEVYERVRGVGDDWHPTEMLLPDFLTALVAFETVLGADFTLDLDGVSEPVRQRLLEGMTELPMAGPMIDSELWAADELLAFTGEGFAYVAAQQSLLLPALRRRIGG